MSTTIDTAVDTTEDFPDQTWVGLTTPEDVEVWIDLHNRDLQQCVTKANTTGYGVCFCLTHGGQIYMHTTAGAILLDVTPDAEWAVSVITAATGIEAPQSQVWVLPDNALTPLVLGLNSLIATARIVVSHNFRSKKY